MANLITSLKNIIQENFQDPSRDIRIGIWGTKGSGKTVFLSRLYDALEASPDEWLVAADPEARQFVKKHRREMDNTRKPGVLPLPNERIDEIPIFSYVLKPQQLDIPASKIVLEFIDAPGEFYEDIYNASDIIVRKKNKSTSNDRKIFTNEYEEVEREYKGIVEYLMSCDGIIFLIDPKASFKDGDSYQSLLIDLFQEFQERSYPSNDFERLEQYMAFCVTKVDDDDNLWRQAQDPQKLALELMGSQMLKRLQTYCHLEPNKEKRNQLHKYNRCQFFGVSAIGRYQDSGGRWRKAIEDPNQNNHTSPDIQQPDIPTPESRYSGGYDPEDLLTNKPNNPEPNTPKTPPPSEGFGLNIKNSNNLEPQKHQPTIKQGVECHPIHVIEPIAWLIEGILNCPPKLPNHQ
ncbi:hypothetical protein LC605_01410 [Nostoc sp. CHAB 5836]|uniref:hypothetical protein n=1 Tax=Nostoc sp. CHAB 5836 TaxID=2780404 RepID=UPI001E5BB1C4|nr:hypothetical protein [Nostoc sp. CHAB 5836]MCC5613757.1 hypothetical protein [Nostoc sp. CHAB 5836]